MILVFQLEYLSVEDKVGFFTAFLASIKSITRSESTISAATYDIIDNIPIVLNQLFKRSALSHDLIIKLIVNLHDTFTSSLLIRRVNENDENDINYNLYLPILENCSKTLSKRRIIGSISFNYSIAFTKESTYFHCRLFTTGCCH